MKLRSGAGLGFALLLLAGTGLLRWPGLEQKFWNVDEAVTFTMARQILAGDLPYRDAVDQRTPLAPYAQAAVFAVAGGGDLRAQHIALALMIGLTAVLLWRLAARLGHGPAGAAGALWFTVLAFMVPSVRDTMAAHTAWYLIFCSTAGFWALARAWTGGGARWAVVSGAAFGLSFLAKQPGVLDFGVALVLMGLGLWLEPARRLQLLRQSGALVAGFALPTGLTAAYFAAQGAWADLVYYTWTYNHTLYVPEVPRLERWQTIRVPFALMWEYHPLATALGGLAALVLLGRVLARAGRRPREMDLTGWLILGWCAAGLVATTLSGRGFTHYSIQLIPGLSLACGRITIWIWAAGQKWAGPSRARRLLVAVGALHLVAWLLWPVTVRRTALAGYGREDDTVVQLVRRHTGPEERIFVWGYDPELYALGGRQPATRFLYCTFLTGLIPWTNLDPLQDTAYAIVPGAWDQFGADWKKHPPALVADSRTLHGFLKHPMENQPGLWPLIERDYARIETDPADRHGFRLYRRVTAFPPGSAPAESSPGPAVQIQPAGAAPGQTARVAVQAPAGTQALELYLDGAPYRRLPWSGEATVQAEFFITGADRPGPAQRVQVVAVMAAGRLASAEKILGPAPVRVPGGPPLRFQGRDIAALESSTITGGPILPKKEEPDHWDAHAPSRLVYPRLPGMNSLAFAYGLEEAALGHAPPDNTDGVEVVVETEDESGRRTRVYRRYLNRDDARRTRGRSVEYTRLPPGGGGKIILLMTPGPQANALLDWSYWLWLRADAAPLVLEAGGLVRDPWRIAAPTALRQAEFNGHFITVTAAPATIDFATTPDLGELAGGFGLLDSAWTGPEKSGPVDFRLELIRPDGPVATLLERRLDPARAPGDRGFQPFKLNLPQPLAGVLRFSTRTQGNPARAHAFWGGLSATTIDLALHTADGDIPAGARSRSDFGFGNAIEDGRPCLFAHASSELFYPWREDLARLTGEFGLMRGAYAGSETTPGVQFIVEVEDHSGARRELFRRHLAPAAATTDRGAQPMAVEIPPVPGGWIIVRTAAAPSGHLNNAWSYWRGLRGGR